MQLPLAVINRDNFKLDEPLRVTGTASGRQCEHWQKRLGERDSERERERDSETETQRDRETERDSERQ